MSKIFCHLSNILSFFLTVHFIVQVKAINQKCVASYQNSKVNALDLTCPQNSQCLSNGYCACEANYFGNCKVNGYLLSNNKQSFNLTQKTTYFIVKPTIDVYVYYQFTLCNPKTIGNQQILNLWYDDGTLDYPNSSNSLGADKYLKITQQCIALMTPFFKFQNQPNGQSQILIFGMRLKNNGNYTISLSVLEAEIFGFQILIKIIIVLICAIFISSLGGIIYCIYKCRRRNLAANLTEQKNDLSFFKDLMPESKANKNQFQDQLCSVCLADILQNQQIRKTVCDHVFHKICLDEWCQTNLSCPICRYPLDKQNIIYKICQKQSSLQNKSNINKSQITQQSQQSEIKDQIVEMNIKTRILEYEQE